MIAYIFTNAVDLGLWTFTKVFYGVRYVVWGETEGDKMRRDIDKILESLEMLHLRLEESEKKRIKDKKGELNKYE